MSARRRRVWSDKEVEQVVGTLLRVGVGLAAAVVLVGGLLYLTRHGGSLPHYRTFEGKQSTLRSLGGILTEALRGRSRAIIQIGLVLLILTPIARVAFSLFAFSRERDWVYVLVTAIVLVLLAGSLV